MGSKLFHFQVISRVVPFHLLDRFVTGVGFNDADAGKFRQSTLSGVFTVGSIPPFVVFVGEGVGVGLGVGVTLGVGVGVGAGVGVALIRRTPLFQTNFLPDFTHV